MADTSVNFILAAKDATTEAFESVKGRLESIKSILETAMIWRGGEMLFEGLVDGVKDFAGALVASNADVETLTTSLAGMYGNATQASQAVEYLSKFSLSAPFAKADILAAGQSIISFGQNVAEVLPALGNVAATMGVDLPSAISSLEHAVQTGSLRGLTASLHITKDELIQFGAQTTATGALVQSSILPAFEALSAAKFSTGMSSQLDTFNGAVTNLKNQLDSLAEIAGKPLFQTLESGLAGLVSFLTSHQADVERFGQLIGNGFALAARVGGAAFSIIGTVVSTFVNWFSSSAMPIVETILGEATTWWETHEAQVTQALTNIMRDVQVWVTYIQTQSQNMMTILDGIFAAGWGIAEIAFTAATDLLSGNWTDFQKDFNDGAGKIQLGAIDMVAGVMSTISTLATSLIGVGATLMLPVANALLDPWTQAARGIRSLVDEIGVIVGGMVGGIVRAFDTAGNAVVDTLNGIIDAYNAVAGKIPFFGSKITKDNLTTLDAAHQGALAQQNVAGWFASVAPGINQNQSITAGNSQAQAAAALAAQQAAINGPMLASLEATRKALIAQYGLDAGGTGSAASQAKGKGILDQINAMIQELLHPKGSGELDAGGIPNLINSNLADPTIAAAIAAAAAAALKAPDLGSGGGTSGGTGRTPLGNLGAAFMQVQTGGGVHGGMSPAERNAQRAAELNAEQLTTAKQQTTYQQQIATQGAAALMEITRVADALTRIVLPSGVPVSPFQASGTLRSGTR